MAINLLHKHQEQLCANTNVIHMCCKMTKGSSASTIEAFKGFPLIHYLSFMLCQQNGAE